MAFDDRGVLEEPEDVRGRVRLAAQRPERVDLRHEARSRSLERLERQRAREVSGLSEPAGAYEAERADGRHELRPVDERQTLLRPQASRFEPGCCERVSPFEQLAA